MSDCTYFYVSIYRTTSIGTIETSDQTAWTLDHIEEVWFIQPRSGTYSQLNQRNTPLSTHVLYSDYDVDIAEGDRILSGDTIYRVDFVPIDGISGIQDHTEIELTILKDLSPDDL